jgi:hypothetical protein
VAKPVLKKIEKKKKNCNLIKREDNFKMEHIELFLTMIIRISFIQRQMSEIEV